MRRRDIRSLECSEAAFMRVCLSARLACFSTACAALMCDSSRAALRHQSTAPEHHLPRICPASSSCIKSNDSTNQLAASMT